MEINIKEPSGFFSKDNPNRSAVIVQLAAMIASRTNFEYNEDAAPSIAILSNTEFQIEAEPQDFSNHEVLGETGLEAALKQVLLYNWTDEQKHYEQEESDIEDIEDETERNNRLRMLRQHHVFPALKYIQEALFPNLLFNV